MAKIDRLAVEVVNERFVEAKEAMAKMNNLRKIFAELGMAGFEKGAEAFKNQVYMMLMENSKMTELEIILSIKNELNF